jgi:elongation factor 1-beta
MGKVSVTIRILPENVDVDLEGVVEEIKKKIPASMQFRGYQISDIAFGLKAVLFNILTDDRDGGVEELNAEIETIGGVGGVEVVDLTLI